MNRLKTSMLLAALAALFMGVGFVLGGPRGAALALAVAAATNLLTLWNADRMLLSLHGARAVDADVCPELVGLVRRLARRAGLPCPRVHVVDSAHPNAFATGRDPDHAAIAVTTGLLAILTRDEIEGVIAHELGHIRNRDTLVMTLAATIAGAIAMVGSLGLIGGRGRNPIALLLGLLVAPVAATVVRLAIGRTREFAADRAGAAISGKPHALASALAKLARGAIATPDPVTRRNPAAAALYIVPGGDGGALFATHPTTRDRIAALARIAAARRPAPRGSVPRVVRRRGSGLDPLGPRR